MNNQRQENYKLHLPFQKGVQMGLQTHYGQSPEVLDIRFLELSNLTQDLRHNPEYQELFPKFKP